MDGKHPYWHDSIRKHGGSTNPVPQLQCSLRTSPCLLGESGSSVLFPAASQNQFPWDKCLTAAELNPIFTLSLKPILGLYYTSWGSKPSTRKILKVNFKQILFQQKSFQYFLLKFLFYSFRAVFIILENIVLWYHLRNTVSTFCNYFLVSFNHLHYCHWCETQITYLN